MNDGLKNFLDQTRWKPHEIEIVKKHWKENSDQEIHNKFLSNRTAKSIGNKRFDLGLTKKPKSPQKHQIWTSEEVEVLKEVWKDFTQQEIHDKFIPSKTPIQIGRKKMDLGLKGKKYVWSEEELEVLTKVGEDFDSTYISKHFLPNKTPQQIRGARKFYCINYKHGSSNVKGKISGSKTSINN